MFFVFLYLSFALKPLFLISGFNGNPLFATVNRNDVPNEIRGRTDFCPQNLENYQFYPNDDKEFYTKYPLCQAYMMLPHYDTKEKKFTHMPGVKVSTLPFGNYSQLLNYDTFVEYALSLGYEPNVNLFGVSYDFMMHPLVSDDTFDIIKANTEKVKKSTGEKIVFITHSQGGHFISQFLSNYSKPDWVKSHVDSVIFVAPAFAGNGNYPRIIDLEYGQFITTKEMKTAIKQMPGQLILLPNYIAFANKTVIHNFPSFGDELKAVNISSFLEYLGRFDDEKIFSFEHVTTRFVFEQIEKYLKAPVPEPPVKSYVLYNTGINTVDSYRVHDYDNKVIKVIMGPGDGDFTPEGSEHACNNWKNVECFNWNMNKAQFNHASMLKHSESVKKIFDFIGNEKHDEEAESSKRELNAILFGAPIVCGLEIVVIVLSLIFFFKKEEVQSGLGAPAAEAAVFKSSEL
ncbi:hypothetical protein TRFO_06243 [Tritrichomonas foetus]|uniref:Lecithin:cholesterol acyltransferase family protein n=1 Tax=Tritrichomonas foetus TaxID=1144522 RepID=A0A1J4K0L2_9EUKA|nr:hypothetical protein TRFO_06243 [Tritrichomonas foetus]|eukprot:OHT04787.1 hypothetical protein TRFO_06243 [Tritrichomonas foetus]